MRRRRTSGSLESEVLAALWSAPAALTTAEVVDALNSGLAYTTVQTILTRLHTKGAVQRQQAGRAHAYSPVLDHAGLAAARMHAMLDRGGDHAAVLSRFLGTLSPEEEATLAALLNSAGPNTAAAPNTAVTPNDASALNTAAARNTAWPGDEGRDR